jgi:hypothetical protein
MEYSSVPGVVTDLISSEPETCSFLTESNSLRSVSQIEGLLCFGKLLTASSKLLVKLINACCAVYYRALSFGSEFLPTLRISMGTYESPRENIKLRSWFYFINTEYCPYIKIIKQICAKYAPY